MNELTSNTNGGTLTVVGTTTSPATSVTVNSTTASNYNDATFAATNMPLTTTYTAIASDTFGRHSTNTVTVSLSTNVTFQYDGNGNLTNDGLRNFVYDDENELIQVSISNAWMSQFQYDGKMRRRIRTEFAWQSGGWVQTNVVYYVYDGSLVIQERNVNNLPTTTYTRGKDLSGSLEGAGGIGGLLSMTLNTEPGPSGSNSMYYHSDGNGNVTMLLNPSQAIVAKYLYDAFGNILAKSGLLADANLCRSAGKEAHPPSGLVYYLYRYYDPNLQRWPSRDPFGEKGGLNLYVFVSNDPLDKSDLLGLCSEQIGKNGLPRMVFTDPNGGWSGGTLTFGGNAGGGAIQEYTTATVVYTADVTVLCTCPCGQRRGVRVFTQQASGDWPFYNPGTVGLGVSLPTATGVLDALGKIGASWIKSVIGAGIMVQSEINDAANAVKALQQPEAPTDGVWKNGKSPCSM